MCYLVLTDLLASISTACDIAQDGTQYTLHRILHGVPEGHDDIVPQQAFPMDSNMDLMGGRKWIF